MIKRWRLLFVGVLLSTVFSFPAAGTDYGWDNGAGTFLWSNPTNWLPDGLPGPGDTVTVGVSCTNDAAFTFTKLIMTNNMTVFNRGGSLSISACETIDSIYSRYGKIDSPIFLTTNLITSGALCGIDFRGQISGAFKIIGNGGRLGVLCSSNTFSGGVDVRASALYFANGGLGQGPISLGATAGDVTLYFPAGGNYALCTNTITVVAGSGLRCFYTQAGNSAFSLPAPFVLERDFDVDAAYTEATPNNVLNLTGAISGMGGITKNYSVTAMTFLFGSNSYRGRTRIGRGTLGFSSLGDIGMTASSLGAPTNEGAGVIDLGATNQSYYARLLYTNGAGHASNRRINLPGSSTSTNVLDASGVGAWVLDNGSSCSVTGANNNLLLQGSGVGWIRSPMILGTGTLTKAGSGTWFLSGSNSYAGATLINGGRLVILSTNGTATGTNRLSVATNATLAGLAQIRGAVVIDGGGILAPGTNAIGMLTMTDSLTMCPNSVYVWKQNSITQDLTVVSGTLDLPSSMVIQVNRMDATEIRANSILFSAGSLAGATDLSQWRVSENGYCAEIQGTCVVLVPAKTDLRSVAFHVQEPRFWGQSFAVTDTVANVGTVDAGTFRVNYYASPDATIGTDDFLLGSRWVSALATGSTMTASTNLSLPVTPPPGFTVNDSFYVGMFVDAYGDMAEADEGNNANVGNGIDRAAVQVFAADLVALAIDVPDTIQWRETVAIPYTVKNIGTGTSGVFSVNVYVSADSVMTTNDAYLGMVPSITLKGGQTTSSMLMLAMPSNPPSGFSATGDYYIGMVVNPDRMVSEASDTNNTLAGQAVHLDGSCDVNLMGSGLDVGDTLAWSRSFIVTSSVFNGGSGTAGNFVVQYYLSTDATIATNDILIGGRTVSGLAAGATNSAADTVLTLPAPSCPMVGTRYIGMIIDPFNSVNEFSKNDNQNRGNGLDRHLITLGVSDMRTTLLECDRSMIWGQMFTVTNSVQNNGTLAVSNGTVDFFLSADSIIDAGDVHLGSRVVSSLATGVTSQSSTSLTLPSLPPPGWTPLSSGYIGMIVDQTNGLGDIYLFNNCNRGLGIDSALVSISPASALPDLCGQGFDSPEPLAWGQSFCVTDTVGNAGSAAAGGFEVGYYLCTNSTITTNGAYLGSRMISSLGTGVASTAATSLVLPASPPAGFSTPQFIGMIVDANESVTECCESNNSNLGDRIDQDDLRSFVITPGNTVIVRSDLTNGTEAALLQTWMRWAFNTTNGFDISTESAVGLIGSRTVLSVGKTAWVAPDDLSGLYTNAARLKRAQSNVVVLCSPSTQGTEWGIYEFLDQYVGVRFYLPGDLYTSQPCWQSLELGDFNAVEEPYVKSCYMSGLGGMTGESSWMTRNRVLHRLGGSHQHTMWERFPPGIYSNTVPEIYPMVSGARYIPTVSSDQGWQPCFTEPHLLEAAMQSAATLFAGSPQHTYMAVSVMDGGAFCECPRCMEVINQCGGDSLAGYSRMYWDFMNALAAEFEIHFPDKRLLGLAYSYVQQMPLTPLRPNIVVFNNHHLGELLPDGLLAPGGALELTLNVASHQGNHDWLEGAGYYGPRIYNDYFKQYMQAVHDSRVDGSYAHAEAYANWGLDGPKCWVVSRLWWNPELDLSALEKQFCDDLFGPASSPMYLYFNKLDDLWKSMDGIEGPERKLNLFFNREFLTSSQDRDLIAECRTLLDTAAGTAGLTSNQSARINLFSKTFRMSQYFYEFQAAASIPIEDVTTARAYMVSNIINDRYTVQPATYSVEYVIDGLVAGKTLAPDLTAVFMSSNAVVTWGKAVMLTNTVKNQGTAIAGSSCVGFYLSKDNAISTNDYGLGGRMISSLAINASNTDVTTLTIPVPPPSGFVATQIVYIGMICDSSNTLNESREVNNCNQGDGKDRVAMPSCLADPVVLMIAATPGVSLPAAGLYTNDFGFALSASVLPPAEQGGTQLVCSGWTLSGHAPASGGGPSCSVALTNDAVLDWKWSTNLYLTVTVDGRGEVNRETGWFTLGSNVEMTATADAYAYFTNWTGDMPGGQLGDSSLCVTMTVPRSVTAHFISPATLNTATPIWWLVEHGMTNFFEAAITNDSDTDGLAVWQEYVADTDPTNHDSCFAVLNLVPGLDNGVTFSCSTARLYSLNWSTNLGAEEWETASGQSNVPGSASGSMTLVHTNPVLGPLYYRVNVDLP